MRTGGENTLMDTFDGANLSALAAVDTFFVIYRCEVILDDYCARWANSLAFSAGYATVFTELTYLCSLIMIIAGNHYPRRVTYQVNNTVRAFLNAHSASDAPFR